MKNLVQEGKILGVTAPYALTSGDGCLVGALFGVATMDAANGAAVEIMLDGVFELKKTSAQAWAVGDRIYWDNSAKECTTVKGTNTLIGAATEAVANPSSTGNVHIAGEVNELGAGGAPLAAIVDLTDSTGFAGTHDDTLAASAAPVDLTDNTGGAGTHDDTLAAPSVPVDLTGGESPTEAEHNALLAAVRIMNQNDSDTAQKVKELVALVAVLAQNDSDNAQKIKELRAALVSAGVIAAA